MLMPRPFDCQAHEMRIQVRGLSSCLESGTTERLRSSSPIPLVRHEQGFSYASRMERKSFGFGKRLKAAREKLGMSGTTLGKGAGENGRDASKASVSDWEHERHYPKADQLRVICLKLNINVDELIFGDIRENMQMIQAESAIRALTPEQRQILVDRMTSSATDADSSVINVTPTNVNSSQTLSPSEIEERKTVSTRAPKGYVFEEHEQRGAGHGKGNTDTDKRAKPPSRKSAGNR